jgi:isoquinoline 1-oxidoreductase alpha subunit
LTRITINGEPREIALEEDTPLLWVLRDALGLVGTKYGCGIAACGACTVLMDGAPVRSCVVPLRAAAGRAVVTIEGVAARPAWPALREAWIAEQVPQCGYCQSGLLVASLALLEAKRSPSDSDINAAVTNLCRCGTYPRVRRAIHRAAARLAKG